MTYSLFRNANRLSISKVYVFNDYDYIILLVILERMFLLSYNTYSLYVIGLYKYSYNTVFYMLYYIIVCVNNT